MNGPGTGFRQSRAQHKSIDQQPAFILHLYSKMADPTEWDGGIPKLPGAMYRLVERQGILSSDDGGQELRNLFEKGLKRVFFTPSEQQTDTELSFDAL